VELGRNRGRIAMSKKQRTWGYIAFGAFAVTVLLSPWRVDTKDGIGHIYKSDTRYQPVFVAPDVSASHYATATLAWQQLICTWAAIGIGYAGIYFLTKNSK